jgi:DNA-binding transcriptional ArsR family regulator
MTEQNDERKYPKEIEDIFTNYHRQLEEANTAFRSKLKDKYCKKIFDKLLLEAPLKKQFFHPKFRYNEIYNLVEAEMTKPTLDLHLKHLEQTGFITKRSKTKYKTSYQINVITEPKVVQKQKTILGKEKLVLTELSKVKIGRTFYLPPNLKLAPESEIPPDKRLHYKD